MFDLFDLFVLIESCALFPRHPAPCACLRSLAHRGGSPQNKPAVEEIAELEGRYSKVFDLCQCKLRRSCQNKDLSLSEHCVEASLPNESRIGLQPNHIVKSCQVSMAKDPLNRTLDHLDFEGFQAAFQAP